MRELLSILVWIYYVICFTVYFALILLIFLITFPFDKHRKIPNKSLKGLGFLMLKLNPFWNIEIRGTDKVNREKNAIFVSNHQSFLDMPLIYLLPWSMKWVAKRSLFNIPILGWLIKMTGHIAIDRRSMRSIKKLDQLVIPIKEGIPAMIFPEGTRTVTGNLRRFKDGAFFLAKRYNFTLYPLVLDGGYKVLPTGEWRFKFKQKIVISVLQPVSPDEFGTVEELKTEIYLQIKRELDQIRSEG